MTKEQKVKEAVERMKTLEFSQDMIDRFLNEGEIYYSQSGCSYLIKDECAGIVKNFEQEHNAVVYHSVLSEYRGRKVLALLYVSNYEDEWQNDMSDLKNRMMLAYVYDFAAPELSKLTCIGVMPVIGGIMRLW